MKENSNNRVVAVVAGEASGDLMGAGVVRAIRKRAPDTRFVGIGGQHLAAQGVELVARIEEFSALGLLESALSMRQWMKAYADLRVLALELGVDCVLLVDCPEVNFRFARAFKREGTRVLWFVGPKVWAWRAGRLKTLRAVTDVVALLFPFEKPMYDEAGVASIYVGHPLAHQTPGDREKLRGEYRVLPSRPLVALLPGSRRQEIQRHWDVLLHTGSALLAEGICPVIAPLPGTCSEEQLLMARQAGVPVHSSGPVFQLLCASDAALVASGTATLEAAVSNVPFASFYKIDPLSYAVARRLLKIPYVTLPNLIAGRPVIEELLQDDCTVTALLAAVHRLLDPDVVAKMRYELAAITEKVRIEGTYDKVASCLLSFYT